MGLRNFYEKHYSKNFDPVLTQSGIFELFKLNFAYLFCELTKSCF